MKFLLFIFFSLFFLFFFIILFYFLSYYFFVFYNYCSSFECGFSPFLGPMALFSMPFFVVSIMFLLFDVEILLLCFFPMVYSTHLLVIVFIWLTVFFIMVITLYEWACGGIVWL